MAAQFAGPDVRAEAPSRPNVLFIAVDDLNDWTGFLGGHPEASTPNIDRLARRGVAFTRAYCAAPACNPSRASLLTGVRPSTSGVYHNDQPWRPVLRDAVTLPQHFRAAGYHVVGGGKIFHNAFNDPASWDEWHGLSRDDHPVPGRPRPTASRARRTSTGARWTCPTRRWATTRPSPGRSSTSVGSTTGRSSSPSA